LGVSVQIKPVFPAFGGAAYGGVGKTRFYLYRNGKDVLFGRLFGLEAFASKKKISLFQITQFNQFINL